MEKGENQSGVETEGGHGIIRWVWIAGLVSLFYVLSVGPAAKLVDKGVIKESVLRIYWPLDVLARHSPGVKEFFTWYIGSVWGLK